MSRGIGHMQREILTALETRSGGDLLTDSCGSRAWLTSGTHDLRKVSQELSMRLNGKSHCNYATESWPASFSRAIAGLAQRRKIEILWLVPLEAAEREFAWPRIELDSNLYLQWFSRQRRFVGNRPDFLKQIPQVIRAASKSQKEVMIE